MQIPRRAQETQSLLFLALGRRGAIPRLALQLALAGAERDDLRLAFVVSRSSELFDKFAFLGRRLLAVDTIQARSPAATARNYLRAKHQILDRIAGDQPDAVVNLCPHLWTPLLMAGIRKQAVPFITVLHDAVCHPGDPGALLMPWFQREARRADAVVTLSRSVAAALEASRTVARERILPLFLPDLMHGSPAVGADAVRPGVFRVLHFGRILKYKGIELLLEALEMLAARGTHVALTIAGAGRLAPSTRTRLATLHAEVFNRWIADAEIGPLLRRHNALVVSHLECSQSGSAAAAFGAGLPVIAVPTGGLAEQVIDGKTGVLASETSASALATAIRRLATDPDLQAAVRTHLDATRRERSTQRFLDMLLADKPWGR